MDERQNKMDKGRKFIPRKGVFAALALVLMAAVIGSTYARYVSTSTGNGSVEIAKWAVKVNGTDISTASGTFKLDFTAKDSDTVSGKVAPGGTASAYVDVDLTGTEVSVDFSCELGDAANLCSVFGEDYASKVAVSVGTPVLKDSASNMSLDAAKKIVKVGSAAMNGTVRVPITLTWTDHNDNSAADTAAGIRGGNVTIPVNLSVKQHISTDGQ